MTLQETFAYLMAREELAYPMADGSPPPAPLEPCRWVNGPWEHTNIVHFRTSFSGRYIPAPS